MKIHNHILQKSLILFQFALLVIIPSVACTKPDPKICDCDYLNICVEGQCKHKPFFTPYPIEILGGFIIICGSALSNAGGIGGGGLLVPILILLLKFHTHEAIPVSKLMIFTGALTAFFMGLKNRHPYRNSSPVDFNITGLMIPFVLFGTMLGVSLNKFFPPPMILICLTLVLMINTYKTFSKAFLVYKKETIEQSKKREDRESANNPDVIPLKSSEQEPQGKEEKRGDNSLDQTAVDKPQPENLQGIESSSSLEPTHEETEKSCSQVNNELLEIEYQKDARMFPCDKVVYMLITYIILITVSLLKGSEHVKSLVGVTSCSVEYWITYLSFIPFAIGITFVYARKVLQEYYLRKSVNYPYHSSDIQWSLDIIIIYPLYALFGGIMAGLLGIGGGLIIGPLLLDLGIHPLVSTATTNFLVLFTSSSTSLQFILHGMMNINYGIVCVICASFGSYIGTFAMQKIIAKTGRASMIIFALACVLALSTVLIPIHALLRIAQNAKGVWKFGSPC